MGRRYSTKHRQKSGGHRPDDTAAAVSLGVWQPKGCRGCIWLAHLTGGVQACHYALLHGVTRTGLARLGMKPMQPGLGEKCGLYQTTGRRRDWSGRPVDRGSAPAPRPRPEPDPKEAEKERRRMELYEQGLSDKEIARETGMSPSGVTRWRQKNRLASRRTNGLTPEQEERRMELYRQGMNDRQIADALGVTPKTVGAWRYRRKLKCNDSRDLTPEEDAERMELYRKGLNDRLIAAAVGRSKPAIRVWRDSRGLPPNGIGGRPKSKDE